MSKKNDEEVPKEAAQSKTSGFHERRVMKQDDPGKGTYYLASEDANPNTFVRKPTDCACCCLFVAAIAALALIHRDCLKKENPFKILAPLDHAGNACGLGAHADYPFVYYPAKKMTFGGPLIADVYYANPKNLWSVCTQECPTTFSRRDREGQCAENNRTCTWYSERPAKLYLGRYCVLGSGLMNRKPDSTGTVCQSAQEAVQDVQDEAFQSLDNMGNSTRHYLRYINDTIGEVKTDPDMRQMMATLDAKLEGRVDAAKNAIRTVGSNTTEKNIVRACKDAIGHQKSYMTDFISDVVSALGIILSTMGVCLAAGGLYLLLICFFVKPIVWGSIFFVTIGFAVGGWLFWDESIKVADTGLVEAPASEEKVLAALCWLCSLVCLVIVFACRRALQLAIAISSVTSGFLLKNAGIMLLPQLLCLVQVAFLLYWVFGLAAILSTAKVLPAENMTEEYNRYVIDDIMEAKIIFHFFVGIWVNGFLEGLTTVATSITVTEWYYKPKVNGNKPSSHCSFIKGLTKAVFYHSGSVAFGSLVVAIVQVLRLVLQFYEKSVKQVAGGSVAKCLLSCCQCCLNCLVRVLKFINFNAYIMVGISGKPYIRSAKEAWGVVTRNPQRFVIFHGVMWTVNVIGRLFIIGVGLLWGALLLNKTVFPDMSPGVHSPWPVLLCIIVVGYMLSGIVFGTFTTAGASLFYNFVSDEEVISSSGGKDSKSYAPGDLGSLLDAEAKKKKEREKPDEKMPDEEAPEERPQKRASEIPRESIRVPAKPEAQADPEP